MSKKSQTEKELNGYVPPVDKNYIQWGNYGDVKRIVEAKVFYPIWITGLSGNGKTKMVEQVCAELGREFFRVNFTAETDENDLIYSMSLVKDGEATVTKYEDGPVVSAMRRGAILLCDEIDVSNPNRVLCLQSVLEGVGVLMKRTGEWVEPAPGFQIFATSNTKGRGSDDGRFIGTNIMNGAMLDRFAGMIEQDYPTKEVENDILERFFVDTMFLSKGKDLSEPDVSPIADAGLKFIDTLTDWASQVRDTYKAQGIEEVITTRTLINVIKGYSIFNDKKKSITFACERYPADVRDKFLSIYDSLQKDEDSLDKGFVPSEEDEKYRSFKQETFS